MSPIMRPAITAIAALLFVTPALAQTAAPQDGPITCAAPVSPDDSVKSLRQRYGEAVALEDLPGAEGETYKALVLLPRAMDRRIEVAFTDDSMKRVSGLTLRDTAKTSRWSVAGVTIGSGVADVQKLNGKPFVISGFGWDYGGFVVDWKGGALARPLPGGCTVTLRFGKDAGGPKSLQGDGVKVSSDNAALLKWAPVVTEIGVNFAEK